MPEKTNCDPLCIIVDISLAKVSPNSLCSSCDNFTHVNTCDSFIINSSSGRKKRATIKENQPKKIKKLSIQNKQISERGMVFTNMRYRPNLSLMTQKMRAHGGYLERNLPTFKSR